ncbi:hypothetical protein Tco_1335071 [Tanacetum coccineum]
MSEIRELHAADRRRQAVISDMLKADQRRSAEMRELRTVDHTRQQQLIQTLTVMQSLQGQVTTLQGQKIAPKRAIRSTPVTTTPAPTATTTTLVTNAQLQAMIDQGVTAALAARDANRNGDDNHTSGTGGRRTERVARECTYQDFMKCKPLYFKGTEGVIELTQWRSLRKENDDKYCPKDELKSSLKVYVSGMPDRSMKYLCRSKPKTMEEALLKVATKLMDKKVSTLLKRQAGTKGS